MNLDELLDIDLLAHHISTGNINTQQHPTEPVTIYNYTHACQYNQAWDDVTRTCRGLIVHADTNEILARPLAKFFNLSEHGPDTHAGDINLTAPMFVFDKADGSLGIAWRRPSDGGLEWATRGSFTSHQALWANKFWTERFDERSNPPDGVTWCAEIIYPDNRIVVDYGNWEALILLAEIEIATGLHVGPVPMQGTLITTGPWPYATAGWHGWTDDIMTVDRNARPETEGYVVLSSDMRTRVKLKSDEYMRLHKLLTGVSTVTIWHLLANQQPLNDLLEVVPDEFAAWVKKTVADLLEAHNTLRLTIEREYQSLDHLVDRKAFAAEAIQSPHKSFLFALLDGKNITPMIWKAIKPERSLPFTNDEEVAA